MPCLNVCVDGGRDLLPNWKMKMALWEKRVRFNDEDKGQVAIS